MRELTASMQQQARRTQLRRLAQTYRANLDALIEALADDDLGTLAHRLSAGASVPRERQGKLLGTELLAGAGQLALLLADLDGAEAEQLRETQRQDLLARRAAVRPPDGAGGVSAPDPAITGRYEALDATTGYLGEEAARPPRAGRLLSLHGPDGDR